MTLALKSWPLIGYDINKDEYPLIEIVKNGNLAQLMKKLEKVDPDNMKDVLATVDRHNHSALHHAAYRKRLDIFDCLVSNGAIPDEICCDFLKRNLTATPTVLLGYSACGDNIGR